MCPYRPKHFKGSKIIRKTVIKICSNEELDIINS